MENNEFDFPSMIIPRLVIVNNIGHKWSVYLWHNRQMAVNDTLSS